MEQKVETLDKMGTKRFYLQVSVSVCVSMCVCVYVSLSYHTLHTLYHTNNDLSFHDFLRHIRMTLTLTHMTYNPYTYTHT